MLVSVCIPTYQGAAYLGQAIDSVLAQTLQDFELLVVDNHSTDGTEALVARYTDSRIRFLRNERNLGAEANWNRCLEQARGTYIKLLPHDDMLAPDCLRRQVEALEQDRDGRLALAFCARTVVNAAGRPLMRRGYRRSGDGAIAGEVLRRQCLRRGTNLLGEPGAVLFRRALAQRVGGFDGEIGYVIDLDYWFRLLQHGDAWYSAEALASFRVTSGSWSAQVGRSQGEAFRRFLKKTGARGVDLLAGSVMGRVNGLVRMAFYRFGGRA